MSVQRLARTIRDAAKVGGASLTRGTVMAITGTTAEVDVPGVGRLTAQIPGSLKGVVVDREVALTVQGDEGRVVASVLTPQTPPTVAAAVATSLEDPDYLVDAGFSMSGFTAQDVVLTNYIEYIAEHLIATNDLVEAQSVMINQLRQALLDAGIIQ